MRRSAPATRSGRCTASRLRLKDLIEIEGRVTTGGCEAWRERRSPHTATLAQTVDRAGHDRAGQDAHGRVRNGRLGNQHASRHAVESLGPAAQAHPGRVEQRLGRRGRGRARALGGRHGYRRLGPPAGVLVRHHRPQDHDRAGQHLWRAAPEPDPGHARTDGPFGRGRGPALRRHAGRRPARSAHRSACLSPIRCRN